MLAAHVRALLGVGPDVAGARLRALTRTGLLRAHAVLEPPGRCFQITRSGLDAAGAQLPAPRLDPRGLRHDAGLAWLWLAARGGAFGEMAAVVSERRMRSRDAAAAHDARSRGAAVAEPFGVRLGGGGAGGRERFHYPDLLLLRAGGGRLAVELELTGKPRTRRERILAGYGADRRVDGVLYLVEIPRVGREIEASAGRLGVADRVRVQPVRWLPGAGSAAPARAAVRTRAGAIEAGR